VVQLACNNKINPNSANGTAILYNNEKGPNKKNERGLVRCQKIEKLEVLPDAVLG
jgi:hypothetical protein